MNLSNTCLYSNQSIKRCIITCNHVLDNKIDVESTEFIDIILPELENFSTAISTLSCHAYPKKVFFNIAADKLLEMLNNAINTDILCDNKGDPINKETLKKHFYVLIRSYVITGKPYNGLSLSASKKEYQL